MLTELSKLATDTEATTVESIKAALVSQQNQAVLNLQGLTRGEALQAQLTYNALWGKIQSLFDEAQTDWQLPYDAGQFLVMFQSLK